MMVTIALKFFQKLQTQTLTVNPPKQERVSMQQVNVTFAVLEWVGVGVGACSIVL